MTEIFQGKRAGFFTFYLLGINFLKLFITFSLWNLTSRASCGRLQNQFGLKFYLQELLTHCNVYFGL